MGEWFGSSWATMAYVSGGTAAMYLSTLAAVRIAGRRTLAQFSAFDAVVTVAVGSLVATTAVSRDPSYLQGVTALVTLLSLQVVVGALRRWVPATRRVLDFRPIVIVRDGVTDLPVSMLSAQPTDDELASKLREMGVFDRSRARLVILEPTGGVSVDTSDGETGEEPRI